ncbi:helix-turn-helix transcriptional regulator [Streptomyces sp. McG3]|uniref:helix-turn-helix domain-containing protein n=1 Tax=Streptomyces sp. McG3 TaxID=2725483 RepID=UPI001BE6FDF7|nr:helix-turn-helix transcriptional regulator [Streptomyces sp. McG3]MBT2901720.1 helix-turn-helix domain-containing protein [Streptomyces sp. McG3]
MAQDDEAGGTGSATGPEPGARPEDEPGSGVMLAFGRQLKLLRMRAGLDRTEFGNRVGYAAQSVASFEQGRRIPQPGFIDQADPVLDAGGLLLALKEEVARAQYPAFFRDAARLEAKAVALCVYALYAAPGLLQTADYARAGFRMERPLLDDEAVEQGVSARLARQEVYDRRPAPLLSFILDEGVLRRPIGGKAVLRAHLEQITRIGEKRNVEVQVMPLDREDHAALGGPFTLIDNVQGRRIAYAEVQGESRLYTVRTMVRDLEARYGIIRSQALTPRESLKFIRKLLGEL